MDLAPGLDDFVIPEKSDLTNLSILSQAALKLNLDSIIRHCPASSIRFINVKW